MRRLITLFLFAILFGSYAFSYDFSAVCSSGQTLYYNITSDTVPYTVEMTYQASSSNNTYYSTYPTGDLVIPESIVYNNVTYSVTSITYCAFYNCSELTSVAIPNSVTSIGNSAFSGCSGLTTVTIPDSVTEIGQGAFKDCSGLTSLTIPNSVTSIGDGAFKNCIGLELIVVDSGNHVYDSRENCNAIIKTETNALIFGCMNTIIPNSVTSIGVNAFYSSGLTTITIPNSVTSIEGHAFSGCSGLTSLTIPNSVTSIGGSAFSYCSGLTSVTIGNSVDSIGLYAFDGCNRLEIIVVDSGNHVYDSRENCNAIIHTSTNTLVRGCVNTFIPNSITCIGNSAFDGCSELTTITIPNSITNIEKFAFYNCSSLTEVTIPNSVTSIGDRAFWGCSGLTSVTIGNSVDSMSLHAFDGCVSVSEITYNAINLQTAFTSSPFIPCKNVLHKINIGDSVMQIPNYMFYGCEAIDTIVSQSFVPSIISAQTFEYSDIYNVPVIVPCGTVDAYNNADFWYNFHHIQQSASCPVPYTITVLTSNPNYGVVTGGGEYLENTMATLTATPYEECMFVNWSDGNTDNPREITVTEDATYIATFVRGNINPTIYNVIADTACGSYIWNDITYTESGDYEQIFTASSSADSIVTLHLTILPLPEPVIIVDGILDACNPETTSVTLHTGEYDSYIWSNSTTGESAIVTTPGEYFVEVVDSMGCHGFSEGVTVGYSTILTEAPQIKNAGMSDNGFNVIGWRVSQTEGIASFEIYREDNASDVFSLIAVVTRSSARTYIDSTANPSARAYRYKICAVDACGGMSPMSEPHKTMHLTINQGVGNDWNLIWSHYEGLDIRSYKIYRGTTKANMVVIGEVPSSQNTFTDSSNPYNIGFFYKIAIVKNTRSDDEEMLTSNIVDNGYIVTHNVIVASSNSAYGSVSGGGVYPEGTEIEIEATANAGYEFSAWNDGSTENPRRVTITSDTLFIANFMEISQVATYNIIVYSSNQEYGTVTGGGTYEEGAEIQLTATANDGYEFVSWSDGSMDNPRTITVIEDAVYIATFAEASSVANYTITVISSNPTQGSVTGGGSYPEGSVISVEAIANDGYQFVSWSDNCTDNPRSITVVSDVMYIATFVPMTDIPETSTLEISIFPNPVNDILNITSSRTISEIEFVNVIGQVVRRIEVNSDNVVCNVEDLMSGVYVVKIRTASATLSQRKFVKE